MLKTLIIDDEERSRVTLKSFIKSYAPFIEITGEADGVKKGIAAIGNLQPDLVFLDIQMGDGTGFDLLEKINHYSFKLIFVTAFDQYAIKAFRFNAIDYLLKPLDPDVFMASIEKLKSAEKEKDIQLKIEALMQFRKKPEKIALPAADSIKFVNISDIVYLASDNNYTTFYLKGNEKTVVSKTIKDYEEMFAGMHFYRIHQSYIINLHYVKKYIKGEGGYVEIENGPTLEVARRRKEGFLQALANL